MITLKTLTQATSPHQWRQRLMSIAEQWNLEFGEYNV